MTLVARCDHKVNKTMNNEQQLGRLRAQPTKLNCRRNQKEEETRKGDIHLPKGFTPLILPFNCPSRLSASAYRPLFSAFHDPPTARAFLRSQTHRTSSYFIVLRRIWYVLFSTLVSSNFWRLVALTHAGAQMHMSPAAVSPTFCCRIGCICYNLLQFCADCC